MRADFPRFFGFPALFCCSLLQQSALLLQDAGVLYMMLKAASGGHAYAQFVCQRVLPSLGLLANDIEGKQLHIVCGEAAITAYLTFPAALFPALMSDDPKTIGPAIVAISRARMAPP